MTGLTSWPPVMLPLLLEGPDRGPNLHQQQCRHTRCAAHKPCMVVIIILRIGGI